MTAVDAPPTATPAPDPDHGRAERAVVVQLALAEARRLATHPVVWVALALAAALFFVDILALRFVLPREAIHVQFVAMPIAAAALFVTHLATTRPRRDDVTEVLEPASHGQDARIRALLLAALTPALLTAGMVAVLLGAVVATGATGPMAWTEAATGPAIVAAAGVLGVLLGRVAPWRLTPLFAVVVVAAAQLFIFEGPPGDSLALRQLLGPIVTPAMGLADPAALVRPAGLHLLYVLGVGGVLAAVAAMVDRRSVVRVTALAVAVAVTAGAGLGQLLPPSDAEVDALLARVGDPEAAGECADDGTGATVCALPMYLGWRDGWREVVHDVRAPLVERGVDPGALKVVQRADPAQAAYDLSRWTDRQEVDAHPLIQAAWDREYVDLPDTVLLTAYWERPSDGADLSGLDLALHVARHATDLPGGYRTTRDPADGSLSTARVCDAAGQAREAITLWLGARSGPGPEGALRAAVAEAPYPGADAPHSVLALHLWSASVATEGPAWSQPSVDVALQLLDRPDEQVLDALTADWARWIDPATSLRELVDELGLTMPPLAPDVAAEIGDPEVAAGLELVLRDTPLAPLERGPDGEVIVPDDEELEDGAIGCP